MRRVPSMAVPVYLPPLGAVKAAISVRVGEASSVCAEERPEEVVEGAALPVPFWVWKSVTSGSRRL
jgi:hypothetical protein